MVVVAAVVVDLSVVVLVAFFELTGFLWYCVVGYGRLVVG